MTGGRLKRVREYIGDDTFCMTYGDGLSDVNIKDLIRFHESQKTLATVTAIQPAARFGALQITDTHKVAAFEEKPKGDGHWINGGFFVLSPKVLDYIEGDSTIWERAPLERLAAEGQLSAYKHDGFWHAIDTLRDKNYMEELCASGRPPWKVW
jgi:glucose-1-phosphate cytidylyltransferase